MWPELAVGAASGLAADEIRRKVHPEDDNESLLAHLKHLTHTMQEIATYLDRETRSPIRTVVQLRPAPDLVRIDAHARAHNLIFVASAVNVTIAIPGLGSMPFTLNPGWTQLDLPDGSTLCLVAATGQQGAFIKVTDKL